MLEVSRLIAHSDYGGLIMCEQLGFLIIEQ